MGRNGGWTLPQPGVVAEPHLDRVEGAQPLDRQLVRRGSGARLRPSRAVAFARPLAGAVDRLAGQHSGAIVVHDHQRLVTRRVTGCPEDPDALDQFMVAVDLSIVRSRRVDPIQERVVGRMGDLPLGRLDINGDAGN